MKDLEAGLVRRARKGDRYAFEQLVELYQTKMFHLGYRMLGNRQEAEDLVQDTFLRVFTYLDNYDENHKFSTWIYRIATNLCIDRLRKRRKSYSLDADHGDSEGTDGYAYLESRDETPEEHLILTETQRRIRDAIESLPEKYKSIVILKYLQDLSLQEISEVLDMPVTTVKTRVHRAREYLRQRLDEGDFFATS